MIKYKKKKLKKKKSITHVKFGDIEIEKYKFHQHKSPIQIGDVDINKIIVSVKVSFGKKRF